MPDSRIISSKNQKKNVFRSSLIKALNLTLFSIMVPVSTFFCLVAYDATGGGAMTVSKAFTTMAYFGSLQIFFGFNFPRAVLTAAETFEVMNRIKAYLLLAEQHDVSTVDGTDPKCARALAAAVAPSACQPLAAGLKLRRVSSGWCTDSNELKEVDFHAEHGEILTVMGPVGSGKTTLLMVILQELKAKAGQVDAGGNRIFYAAQEAWITSTSVMDNILFGSRYDAKVFATVVAACQIVTDVEGFADSYDTLVGERGITLSGGQKARISLCRAVYAAMLAKQDGASVVLLMDDPFAAIDARVGAALYKECVMGLLVGTTRILCTHQAKYAVGSAQVVVLDRNGAVLLTRA